MSGNGRYYSLPDRPTLTPYSVPHEPTPSTRANSDPSHEGAEGRPTSVSGPMSAHEAESRRVPQNPGQGSSPAKAGPRRTWARLLRLFVFVFIGGLFGAYFSRELWLTSVSRRALAGFGERTFGSPLLVRHVGGDLFTSLRLEGLRLEDGDQVVTRLAIPELELRYSPLGLLRGTDGAFKSIELRDLDLELDLEQSEPTDSKEGPLQAIPRLPRIEVENARVSLRINAERQAFTDGVQLSLPGTDSDEETVLRAQNVRIRNGEQAPLEFEFVTRLLLKTTGLQINAVDFNDRQLVSDGEIRWADPDRPGFGARASGTIEGATYSMFGRIRDDQCSLGVEALELELGPIIDGLWSNSQALTGRLSSLNAVVKFPLDDPRAAAGEIEARANALGYEHIKGVQLTLAAKLDAGKLAFDNFELIQGANLLNARGFGLDLGDGDLEQLLSEGTGHLDLQLADLPALFARNPVAGKDVPPHLLQLEASLAKGELQVLGGGLEIPGGRIDWIDGSLRTDRVLGSQKQTPRLQLVMRAEFEDLAPLGAVLGRGAWAGSLGGDMEFAGAWPNLRGSAQLSGENVLAAGLPLGEVALDLSADTGRIDLRLLEANSADDRLKLSGTYEIKDARASDVVASIELTDATRWLPEGWGPLGTLSFEGNFEGTRSEPRGAWELEARGFHTAGVEVEDLQAAGSMQPGKIQVDALRARTNAGEWNLVAGIDLDERGNPRTLSIERLDLARGEAEVSLSATERIEFNDGWPLFEKLRLEGSAGALEASLSRNQELTSFELAFDDFDPLPFVRPVLWARGIDFRANSLDGRLRGSIQGSELYFASEGSAREVSLKRVVESSVEDALEVTGVDLDWHLLLDEAGLKILRARAERPENGVAINFDGRLPLAPLSDAPLLDGELELHARANFDDLGKLNAPGDPRGAAQGKLAVDLDLLGSWDDLRGNAHIGGEQLSIFAPGLEQAWVREADLIADLDMGQRWTLETLSLKSTELSFDASGSLGVAPDFQGWAGGKKLLADDTPVGVEFDLETHDPELLHRLQSQYGGGFLRRLEGALRVQLALSGTTNAPRYGGHIELDDAVFKVVPEMPAIERANLRLDFDRQRVRINSFRGELGAEPFELSGIVELGGESPELNLELSGSDLLFLRGNGLKMRGDTNLTLSGPLHAPTLAGSMALTDGLVVRNIGIFEKAAGRNRAPSARVGFKPFSFREAPLKDLRFDIKISSPAPLRVRTRILQAELRPELNLNGNGEVPTFSGLVYIDPSRVKLPTGWLAIDSGRLDFESNPFAPELDLTAHMRLSGYDLDLVAQGPYDNPQIIVSSSPPLPQDDAYILLMTGRPPQGKVSLLNEKGVQTVGLYIASDFLSRMLGTESINSNTWFLDRLEVISGRDTTVNGDETLEATFKLAEGVVGKNGDMYLSAEQDVYDEFNFGLRFVFRFE